MPLGATQQALLSGNVKRIANGRPFGSETEHFVTVFDSNYLPLGLAMHSSLMKHSMPFHLWIVCVDEAVEAQIRQLKLPNVSPIPLEEAETEALRKAKIGRSRGEYCWTLTPFAPQFVFDRASQVRRVTYVDADLFFFDDPRVLLRELDQGAGQVLITEHGYDPGMDRTAIFGKYCVQFTTFSNMPASKEVLHWWQDRCVEWCFARLEDGKFGDQKYLDDWPARFAGVVHVLRNKDKAFAPWNVNFLLKRDPKLKPVFFHFHTFRLVSPVRAVLYHSYRVGNVDSIYSEYLAAINHGLGRMKARGMPIPFMPMPKTLDWYYRMLKMTLLNKISFARLKYGDRVA
jgi:hypothetical protein